MNNSPTPRTDKHVADIAADGLADGDFARQLEREVAELLYVVEKTVEWDADNTDNPDLAALGVYARAALSKCHAQGGSQ